MDKEKRKAILILGMHRSGTSMLTRVLNLAGVWIGEDDTIMPPKEDNPQGFWENADIVTLQDEILESLGRSWHSTLPLPESFTSLPEIKEQKEKLKKYVEKNYSSHSIWCAKDPRTSLLVPLWDEILSELGIETHYITIVRNPIDVATSLEKRDDFSFKTSEALWFLYSLNSLKASYQKNGVVLVYEDMLNDWRSAIHTVEKSARIELNLTAEAQEEIDRFVDPSMSHSSERFAEVKKKCSAEVSELFNLSVNKRFSFEKKVKLFDDIYKRSHSLTGLLTAHLEGEESYVTSLIGLGGDEDGVCLGERHVICGGQLNQYTFEAKNRCFTGVRINPFSNAGFITIAAVSVSKRTDDIEELITEYSGESLYKLAIKQGSALIFDQNEHLNIVTPGNDPHFVVPFELDGGNENLVISYSIAVRPLGTNGNFSRDFILNLGTKLANLEKKFVTRCNELTQELNRKIFSLNAATTELARRDQKIAFIEENLRKRKEELSKQKEVLRQRTEELKARNEELNYYKRSRGHRFTEKVIVIAGRNKVIGAVVKGIFNILWKIALLAK